MHKYKGVYLVSEVCLWGALYKSVNLRKFGYHAFQECWYKIRDFVINRPNVVFPFLIRKLLL